MSFAPETAARVSPRHVELSRQADTQLEGPSPVRLSLAPAASRAAGLTWMAAAALLLASAAAGQDRRRRRLLGAIVVSAAVFQVVFGTRHFYGSHNTLWGIEIAGSTHLRGTFVNSSHLATYLLIALAITFAWTVAALHAWRRAPPRASGPPSRDPRSDLVVPVRCPRLHRIEGRTRRRSRRGGRPGPTPGPGLPALADRPRRRRTRRGRRRPDRLAGPPAGPRRVDERRVLSDLLALPRRDLSALASAVGGVPLDRNRAGFVPRRVSAGSTPGSRGSLVACPQQLRRDSGHHRDSGGIRRDTGTDQPRRPPRSRTGACRSLRRPSRPDRGPGWAGGRCGPRDRGLRDGHSGQCRDTGRAVRRGGAGFRLPAPRVEPRLPKVPEFSHPDPANRTSPGTIRRPKTRTSRKTWRPA